MSDLVESLVEAYNLISRDKGNNEIEFTFDMSDDNSSAFIDMFIEEKAGRISVRQDGLCDIEIFDDSNEYSNTHVDNVTDYDEILQRVRDLIEKLKG